MVSVPLIREHAYSDPFQRDPSGQHGAKYALILSDFSLHSKGFNRTPNGDSSSTTYTDAGSAGSGSAYPSSQMILARFLWVLLSRTHFCSDLS